MSLSAGQLTLIRTKNQKSLVRLATLQPKTIFACQINDTFSTHDMVVEFDYDSVTTGAYGDILLDQLVWVGSSAGAKDKGIARIRKAPTASTLYIGEVSEIDWENDLYITVKDDFILSPRHIQIIDEVPYMDVDIAYSDQHDDFDPVPIMGGHVVVDTESYPVAIDFPAVADSYVYGSTISSRSFTASDGVVTNGTSTNPTLTINSYPTDGYIRVKLTVTSAAGKSFSGYRYVLVYDTDNRPIEDFEIEDCHASVTEGGWQARVTLHDSSDMSLVSNETLAILYSEDYFDGTVDRVGLIEGRENIWMSGRVFEYMDIENIEHSPLTISIQGMQRWFSRVGGFTTGVEFATTEDNWTSIPNLTVDKGLWHLLHWRTTATRIMDVFLTGDTKYTQECSSAASNFWAQIKNISFSQIFAEPICDYNHRLFIKVPYNLIPAASRDSAATDVMTLATTDYEKSTDIEWRSPSVSQIDLTGIVVQGYASAIALRSLSPGHTPARLGDFMVIDHILLSSQSQSNSLAGLLFSDKNNPYPYIPIELIGTNRAFDVAPIQRATVSFDEYSGYILPEEIDYSFDNGKLTIEITFRAATDEGLSVKGTIPLGNGSELSIPSIPSFPSLPSLPLLPLSALVTDGDISVGPRNVLITTGNFGVLYTTNFDEDEPEWNFMNVGFDTGHQNRIVELLKAPSGGLFALAYNNTDWTNGYGIKLYYASGLGASWVEVYDPTEFAATAIIQGFEVNPNEYESVGIVVADGSISNNLRFYLGDRDGFAYTSNGIGIKAGARCGMGYIQDYFIISGVRDVIFGPLVYSRITAAGALSLNHAATGGYNTSYVHVNRIGPNLYWTDLDTQYKKLWEGYTTTEITQVSGITGGGFGVNLNKYYVASDPTGGYMIGTPGSPSTVALKSTDFGVTWGACTGINVGYSTFDNCESQNAFLAATTQSVLYTPDFGASWIDKSGNLPFVAPLCSTRLVKFVSW